jgi:hypothetical protein
MADNAVIRAVETLKRVARLAARPDLLAALQPCVSGSDPYRCTARVKIVPQQSRLSQYLRCLSPYDADVNRRVGVRRLTRVSALLLATILLGAGGFCIVIGAIIVVAAIGSGSNGDTGPAFAVLVGSAAMLIGAFLGGASLFLFWSTRRVS